MISLEFDWQTNEFMLYCRTSQLREKSMLAYEQALRLFERWCGEPAVYLRFAGAGEIYLLRQRKAEGHEFPGTEKGLPKTCELCHDQQLFAQSAGVL